MKAIPLWQPWASLVAFGAKRVETRKYRPPSTLIGERVAIHATLTQRALDGRLVEDPFFDVFRRNLDLGQGLTQDQRWATDIALKLPLGGVVAVCTVVRGEPITPDLARDLEQHHPIEFAFGDYSVPGAAAWADPPRWAWHLTDVRHVDPFTPMAGKQGVITVPEGIETDLRERGYI